MSTYQRFLSNATYTRSVIVNLLDLMAYKAWANARLFSALQRMDEAALLAPQPIIFGSLLNTLHHVAAMDRVWQAHLLGEAHGYTSRNPQPAARAALE